MAKRKAQAAPVQDVPEPLPPTPRPWRVHLNAPTPLACNPAVVQARSESEARDQFMALNGISGSSHEWTVEQVAA